MVEPSLSPAKPECPRVFIGYARADLKWLERLKVHLRPLEEQRLVELWDDTRSTGGAPWQEESAQALATARIVVLLVSADFFASEDVLQHTLPQLLGRARSARDGLTILPILVGHCLFERSALAGYRPINPPDAPLAGLDEDASDRYLKEVAHRIHRALSTADTPTVRDDVEPALDGTPSRPSRSSRSPGTRWVQWPNGLLQWALALIVGLVFVRWLGGSSHTARALLLGLDGVELHYSEGTTWRTGLGAVVALFDWMLRGPFLGVHEERWVAPLAALLMLSAGGLAGWRWLGTRGHLVRRALLVGLLPLYLAGTLAYAHAVSLHHLVIRPWSTSHMETPPATDIVAISSQQDVQEQFEVYSWLYNHGNPANTGRRIALAGTWGWGMLALGLGLGLTLVELRRSCGARVRGTSSPASPRWARWLLGAMALGYGMMLFGFGQQGGKAYAFVHWGIHYPRVVSSQAACQPALGPLLLLPDCTLFDVSGGAVEEVVVLLGRGCPAGPAVRVVMPPDGWRPERRCIESSGREPLLNRGAE